ncbi:MAG: hypothetical protein K2N88_01515 [Muribaculaceae bacterium]|nr:hypothetical protein [Muribaculaceae bacterium]
MSKFYLTGLMLAVAMSASAASPALKTTAPQKCIRTVTELRLQSGSQIQRKAQTSDRTSGRTLLTRASAVTLTKMTPERAEEEHSITGIYTMKIGDYYSQTGQGEVTINAIITAVDDSHISISSDYFFSSVEATYDATTNKIGFSEYPAGEWNEMDITFQPGYWDNSAETLAFADFEGEFDPASGNISFPADHFFAWAAYDEGELMGYLDVFDAISMEPAVPGDFTIEGSYIMTIDDVYFEDGAGRLEVAAQITLTDDTHIKISAAPFYSPIPADYDATTGMITFGEYDAPAYQDYTVKIVPTHWNNAVEIAPYSVFFNSSTGTITFPADHGIGWRAYTADGATVGWLDLFDVLSLAQMPPEDPFDEEQAGQWTSIGNGTMVDAWVLTAYSNGGVPINPADYPFEVELQQNIENQNLYRVWRPYHSETFPLASSNTSIYQGQIVFDVTDPDHVIVRTGFPAGWATDSGEMYNFDLLGWQINSFGDDYTDSYLTAIYAYMEANNQPFSTFKDGVLTVNASVFDTNINCLKSYTWNNAVTRRSSVAFPGVDGISGLGAEKGEAKFFNLQGVQVDGKQPGILIKVQDGKATKVLVK